MRKLTIEEKIINHGGIGLKLIRLVGGKIGVKSSKLLGGWKSKANNLTAKLTIQPVSSPSKNNKLAILTATNPKNTNKAKSKKQQFSKSTTLGIEDSKLYKVGTAVLSLTAAGLGLRSNISTAIEMISKEKEELNHNSHYHHNYGTYYNHDHKYAISAKNLQPYLNLKAHPGMSSIRFGGRGDFFY